MEYNLKNTLEKFASAISDLAREPHMCHAHVSNIASMRAIDAMYLIEKEHGAVPHETVAQYIGLVNTCLRELKRVSPNGEDLRHLDLYLEQLRGRRAFARGIKTF